MFEVDESGWPIVGVRWTGEVTDGDLGEFFAHLDGWLARGQRFGLLLDARDGSDLNGPQRARVLAHMRATAEKSGTLLVQAFIQDKAVHRVLYTVMSAIFPLPFPSKMFPEPESARIWLADKLRSVTDGRGR